MAPAPGLSRHDGEAQKEVKVRILAELLDGDIPDPRM